VPALNLVVNGTNADNAINYTSGRFDPNDVGPGSLFNQIKKYADTHFTD